MPRGKKRVYNNGKLDGEKSYYYRRKPDVYGSSKIFIEPLNGTNPKIMVNGQEIWLPVLDLNKHYNGAKAYAFIEEFDKYPATMIDILYSSEDIIPRLEKDDRFLDDFLSRFSRKNINIETLKSPGIILMPSNISEQRRFANAIRTSIQENVMGGKYPIIDHYMEEEFEVNDENYDYKNAKEDGIALEFIKDFYEIISGKKIRRPNEPRKKKVVGSLERKAIIMKVGSTVISNEAIGKYCFAYHANVQGITDIVTMQLAGVEDASIFSCENGDKNRLVQFGNVLFESNILETSLYVNAEKRPINIFPGRYNETSKKLEVDKKLEQYFNAFNDLITSPRTGTDGR